MTLNISRKTIKIGRQIGLINNYRSLEKIFIG